MNNITAIVHSEAELLNKICSKSLMKQTIFLGINATFHYFSTKQRTINLAEANVWYLSSIQTQGNKTRNVVCNRSVAHTRLKCISVCHNCVMTQLEKDMTLKQIQTYNPLPLAGCRQSSCYC